METAERVSASQVSPLTRPPPVAARGLIEACPALASEIVEQWPRPGRVLTRDLERAIHDRLGDAGAALALAVHDLADARRVGYHATGSGRLELAVAHARRAYWASRWRTT